MAVLVIVPTELVHELRALNGADVRGYRSEADVVTLIPTGAGNILLLSDALDGSALDGVAKAVRAHPGGIIEVRRERWDGLSPSPLSAACRGVISGFGINGVRAAIALLEREGQPA